LEKLKALEESVKKTTKENLELKKISKALLKNKQTWRKAAISSSEQLNSAYSGLAGYAEYLGSLKPEMVAFLSNSAMCSELLAKENMAKIQRAIETEEEEPESWEILE
jgi:hypothetical protein